MADNDQWYPDSNPLRSQIYVGFTDLYNISNGENILKFTNVVKDSLEMWNPETPSRFICIRRNIYLIQTILTLRNALVTAANIAIRITPATGEHPSLIYDCPLGTIPVNGRIEFWAGGQFELKDYLEIIFTCDFAVGEPAFDSLILYAGVKFSELA